MIRLRHLVIALLVLLASGCATPGDAHRAAASPATARAAATHAAAPPEPDAQTSATGAAGGADAAGVPAAGGAAAAPDAAGAAAGADADSTAANPRAGGANDGATDAAGTSGDAPATPDGEGSQPEKTAGDAQSETPGKEQGEPQKEGDGKDESKGPGRIVLDTPYDDRRVGEEQTDAVAAEMGIVEDPELNAYLQRVAKRLLRYAPPQPFEYTFKIVDQTVPNAFALPGGKIYVSRGLLALVDTEDELAGVLGHEITHAAERHAAARVEIAKRINPLVIGWMRAAQIAAYGRDQERDADRGGQLLCAAAGYDPIGIATFLRKLDALERYEIGWSRLPFFLATHPTSPERAALAADRAASLAWTRQPGVAAERPFGYLSVVDGLVLGDDPAGGLFDGTLFVQPEMRFSIRFPQGWETMNSQQAVSAISPDGDAQLTLTLAGAGDDVNTVVDDFLEKEAESLRVRVGNRREIQLGELPAVRLEGRGREQVMTPAGPQEIHVYVQMTFVGYDGMVYRLALTSVAGLAEKYRGRATAFAMSFRPIDEATAHSLQVTRLRIARALDGETLQDLSERTRNALELGYTGVLNGIFASTELGHGDPVKIGIAEPYLPRPRELGEQSAAASKADGKDAATTPAR